MTKIFTHDDLVRFVYNETSPDENRQIKLALENDIELQEQYQELKWLKLQMDGTMMEPSEKSINTILEYSKAINLHSLKE